MQEYTDPRGVATIPRGHAAIKRIGVVASLLHVYHDNREGLRGSVHYIDCEGIQVTYICSKDERAGEYEIAQCGVV